MRPAETAIVRAPRLAFAYADVRALLARPVALVWTASLLWSALFITIAARGYAAFRDHRFDLGNMTQAVWNTAHGHVLEVTEISGDQILRLGTHVDPLLALFAPLWWIWPSPVMLLAVQILVLALGAVPVFWLARKYLPSERAALQLAVVYLLYPALQWRALNEFYPATVAVTFVLFAIWYLDEDKLMRFAVFAALAAASQEQMGLLVGGLGIWYALRRRRFVVGGLIAAGGVAWTLVAMLVVIPLASGGEHSPFYSHYASIGGSPAGILGTVVSDPLSIVRAAFTSRDFLFLAWTLAPLMGLFVLAPTMALIALPQLALGLLSDRPSDVSIDGNIFSPAIPFLIAATVLGVARLRRSERFAQLLCIGAVLSVLIGPLMAVKTLAPAQDAHTRAAIAAVASIPADAAVSATNDLGSHLAARRYIYSFPVTSKADWVAVDLSNPSIAIIPGRDKVAPALMYNDQLLWPKRFRTEVAKLNHDPHWQLMFSRERILVWHRREVEGA